MIGLQLRLLMAITGDQTSKICVMKMRSALEL